MSKSQLFKTLTKEQKDYIEYLIDEAFARGHDEGVMESRFVESYNRG